MNKIWSIIQSEVKDTEEAIGLHLGGKYIHGSGSLLEAVINILSTKLADELISVHELSKIFHNVSKNDIKLTKALARDIQSYYERDFACQHYLEVLFFSRGFQALEAYRFSHELYKAGKKLTAKWLQYRISEIFTIDIHPAASIGTGLVIDHAMGVVIGETCRIEDDVFMFHNVTLGGTGKTEGDRHPKINSNVVIGAGATILGNITVGTNSNIAAGAVVLKDVPEHTTVAGVPAEPKGRANKVQMK